MVVCVVVLVVVVVVLVVVVVARLVSRWLKAPPGFSKYSINRRILRRF